MPTYVYSYYLLIFNEIANVGGVQNQGRPPTRHDGGGPA